MKVLLAEHSVSFDENDAAFKLFDLLTQAGLSLDSWSASFSVQRRLVTSAVGMVRAHSRTTCLQRWPRQSLRPAAVAIAYLHKCLP